MQRAFGEHIIIARLFVLGIGFLSCIGMFFIGRILFTNPWVSLLMAILFQYSPLFYYYSTVPMPDSLALMGAIWYLYYILRFEKYAQRKDLFLSSVFLLIATLAKLPFLMFSIVSIYLFFEEVFKDKKISSGSIWNSVFQLIIISPALVWYAWVMPTWKGNAVLKGVFKDSAKNFDFGEIISFHLKYMLPERMLYDCVWLLGIIGLFVFFLGKRIFLQPS